jgi:acyl CoA:acetate/3-ketoacid CoA transferase
VNYTSIVDQPYQFDFYTEADSICFSFAQVDARERQRRL